MSTDIEKISGIIVNFRIDAPRLDGSREAKAHLFRLCRTLDLFPIEDVTDTLRMVVSPRLRARVHQVGDLEPAQMAAFLIHQVDESQDDLVEKLAAAAITTDDRDLAQIVHHYTSHIPGLYREAGAA